jgi:hypothetical protein
MGLTCVAPLPEALSPLPEESEELQAATPDSAVNPAIERLTWRTVVLFGPHPYAIAVPARQRRALTPVREKGRAPHH